MEVTSPEKRYPSATLVSREARLLARRVDSGQLTEEAGLGRVWGLIFVLAVLGGCGDSGEYCYVEGSVTYAGQPVTAGLIEFEPADGNSQAHAIPINAGRYETPSGMTIGPGTYFVRITAPDLSTSASTASVGPNDPVPETKPLLPPGWNVQSTLQVELKRGTNSADFSSKANVNPDVAVGS